MMRTSQRERVRAAMRDQYLESLVFRQIDHDARIMRIVLDDEHHAVVRREIVPVIDDRFGRPLGEAHLRHCAAIGSRRPRRGAAEIGERQIQRKGTARPGR